MESSTPTDPDRYRLVSVLAARFARADCSKAWVRVICFSCHLFFFRAHWRRSQTIWSHISGSLSQLLSAKTRRSSSIVVLGEWLSTVKCFSRKVLQYGYQLSNSTKRWERKRPKQHSEGNMSVSSSNTKKEWGCDSFEAQRALWLMKKFLHLGIELFRDPGVVVCFMFPSVLRLIPKYALFSGTIFDSNTVNQSRVNSFFEKAHGQRASSGKNVKRQTSKGITVFSRNNMIFSIDSIPMTDETNSQSGLRLMLYLYFYNT